MHNEICNHLNSTENIIIFIKLNYLTVFVFNLCINIAYCAHSHFYNEFWFITTYILHIHIYNTTILHTPYVYNALIFVIVSKSNYIEPNENLRCHQFHVLINSSPCYMCKYMYMIVCAATLIFACMYLFISFFFNLVELTIYFSFEILYKLFIHIFPIILIKKVQYLLHCNKNLLRINK